MPPEQPPYHGTGKQKAEDVVEPLLPIKAGDKEGKTPE